MGGGHHEETQILSWFSQKVFEVEFMIFKKPYRRVEGYTYLIYHNRYNHVYIYIYVCFIYMYLHVFADIHTNWMLLRPAAAVKHGAMVQPPTDSAG